MQDLLRGALVGLGWPAGRPPTTGKRQDCRKVAVPLLGSRCRVFPKNVMLVVVALEAALWLLLGCGEANNRGIGRRAGGGGTRTVPAKGTRIQWW